MFCKNCGKSLPDGTLFCNKCGQKITSNTANSANQQPKPTPVSPNFAPNNLNPVPPAPNAAPQKKKSNSGKIVLITILILALVAGLSYGGWVVYDNFFSDSTEEASQKSDKDKEKDRKDKASDKEKDKDDKSEKDNAAEEEKVARLDIEEPVNALIASQNLSDSVAVAVVDNKTGERYLCNGANDSYVSWGFYLPVYLAFCDMYPTDHASYKSDIMSSDISKCNSAANFAIDACGGPAGVTRHLNGKGYKTTVCGRHYGDLNATADNYTCAAEAAFMLNKFNSLYNYADLCYSPSPFGVSVPAGASMYAQLGTENINQKNNLNVFAIIKGTNSDYSIVILSKNRASASGIINAIINTVHEKMEGSI